MTTKSKPCIEAEGHKNKKGYVYLNSMLVHRTAWIKAHGYIPAGMEVRHLCHNKGCIEITHLALGTSKENKADSIRDGRTAKGERHGHSILTEREVRQIKKYKGTRTARQLAADFEVSEGAIKSIWSGKTWSWLDENG